MAEYYDYLVHYYNFFDIIKMGMIEMKNKKGFIATSVIYSFFLVFLMLMVTILTSSVNNRVLVGRIKEDIRSEIDG